MTITVTPEQAALTFFLILSIPATVWALLIKYIVIPRRKIAEAEVIDVKVRRSKDGKTLYCPVYSFVDLSNYRREVCNDWYGSRYVEVGAKRKILYDPYKPDRFSLPGLTGIYLGPTILICSGILLTLLPLSSKL